MKDIGKIAITGLLAGVIMLAAGMLAGFVVQSLVPGLQSEYANAKIFRPWSDPHMSVYFVYPFALGVILAWIWSRINHLIMVDVPWKKGLYFALIYWIITIPGMIISYGTFNVSLFMVLSWMFSSLVQVICGALLFSGRLR